MFFLEDLIIFSFEDIRVLFRELVTDVLSECKGAHEQTKSDVEHGIESHCVVIMEGFKQDQEHLEGVFDVLHIFRGAVSSLGVVEVFLVSLNLLLKAYLGAGGSYEEVKLFDLFLKAILICEFDEISCPYIQDERDYDSLGEKESHGFALVGLSDKVEDVLTEID